MIRRATPADLPVLLEHRLALFDEACGGASAAMRENLPAYLAENLDQTYVAWVSEAEGRVVGGVAAMRWPVLPGLKHPNGWALYVLNMFVEPEFRGQGRARALLEAIHAYAAAEGIRTLYLHASNDGRPLYEQEGYAPEPTLMETYR